MKHLFELMESRPTGYRRADSPDDVLGAIKVEELPKLDPVSAYREYRVALVAQVRFAVPENAPVHLASEVELSAKRQLHDLLLRDLYEKSQAVARAFIELKRASDRPTRELDELQHQINDMCDMVHPRSVG